MQSPKLTPLQSRFAASLAATVILVVFYLNLSNPHFAYALETDSIRQGDRNHPPLLDLYDRLDLAEQYEWDDDEVEQKYEPEFSGFDRGIIGRAPSELTSLGNNAPGKSNIQGNEQQYWVFPNETLWGPQSPATPGLPSPLEDGTDWGTSQNLQKRQDTAQSPRVVYISLSTCDQPSSNSSNPNGAPPQLELYISQSSSNPNPGPENYEIVVPVDGGFGNWTLDNAANDLYFGVLAPASSNFNGVYNYELTVSIDAPYASYQNTTFLYFVDSDTNSALLVTNDTTNAPSNSSIYQQWMSMSPPFSVFAQNQNDTAILGIHRSFCGLKNHAQILGNPIGQPASSVDVNMTARAGGQPKEQFYIQDLNGSSAYYVFPAIDGNSTQAGGGVVGGGGMVWAPTNFTTKSDGNCQIIFGLSFCSDVAYAVPSNPDFTDLATFYDNNASSLYLNFNKSLQQIPCDTTSSAQYSLARNCIDCANAYKQWLCAVVVPRCEDFSSDHSWLQPRNIGQNFINHTEPTLADNPIFSVENKGISYLNSSRNPLIDTVVMPGPYKEVLPCKEICYELVRSCPASLGFVCPYPGRGLNYSYGTNQSNGYVTCNYPGAAWYMSVGVPQGGSFVLLTVAISTALFVMHFA